MKTLAISFIFLTTVLNISIFNTDKLTENRIVRVSVEQNNKESVDHCCVMNYDKVKTNSPIPVKTKPSTTKRKATNFYNSSYKTGFVIVDPIVAYSI